jgi:hypothetical protein
MSDTEAGPSPGVSNLRSRFEQLAQSSTPTVLTPSTSFPPSRPSSSLAKHAFEAEGHHHATAETDRTLRPMGSASSLRSNASTRKAPPPPPPPRGAKPAGVASPSPGPSPLLHPTNIIDPQEQPPSTSLDALMARKPPPAPPSSALDKHSEEENHPPAGGVASLRNKFACVVLIYLSKLT